MSQRWAALFEDIADGSAIRAAHFVAHEAFLLEHKGIIKLAGALRPQVDQKPVGGLWIFEGVSREQVEAIVAKDPFYIHGLRASFKLMAWATAPGFETMEIGERG